MITSDLTFYGVLWVSLYANDLCSGVLRKSTKQFAHNFTNRLSLTVFLMWRLFNTHERSLQYQSDIKSVRWEYEMTWLTVKSPVPERLCCGATVSAALSPAVQRRFGRLEPGSRTLFTWRRDVILRLVWWLRSDRTLSPAYRDLLFEMAFLNGSDGLTLVLVPRPACSPHHLFIRRFGTLH